MYALKHFSHLKDFSESLLNYVENYYYFPYLYLFGDEACRFKQKDITWCQELLYHQPVALCIAYGNEARRKAWYKSAAILIRIPQWSEYRQKLVAISTGEHSTKVYEWEMVKDFKDICHESIIEDERKKLLDQSEELLDRQYIKKSPKLVNKLKKMQEHLEWFYLDKTKQLNVLHHVKSYLERLRDDADLNTPYRWVV